MRLLPDIHPAAADVGPPRSSGHAAASRKPSPDKNNPFPDNLAYQEGLDVDDCNNEIDTLVMRSAYLRDLLQQRRVRDHYVSFPR